MRTSGCCNNEIYLRGTEGCCNGVIYSRITEGCCNEKEIFICCDVKLCNIGEDVIDIDDLGKKGKKKSKISFSLQQPSVIRL
jgi:hypothetical protein